MIANRVTLEPRCALWARILSYPALLTAGAATLLWTSAGLERLGVEHLPALRLLDAVLLGAMFVVAIGAFAAPLLWLPALFVTAHAMRTERPSGTLRSAWLVLGLGGIGIVAAWMWLPRLL